MRLIDADELLARYKARCEGCKETKNYCEHCCDIADIISDIEDTLIKNDIEDTPTIEGWKKAKQIHEYDIIKNLLDEIGDERKKGEWENKEVFDEPVIEQHQSARCSVCGLYLQTPFSYYFFEYNYCPYCGADNREEKAK